jgi:hypothetical protein
VGVAKPVDTKPRMDADLNKRGVGAGTPKVCRPASPATRMPSWILGVAYSPRQACPIMNERKFALRA